MRRLQEVYDKVIWINPLRRTSGSTPSPIAITNKLHGGPYVPLTLKGLEEGMTYLSK